MRNPTTRNWSRWVAVSGAVALAIGVAGGESCSIAANKFVSTGSQTYLQAYALTSGGAIGVLALAEELGALMLDAGLHLHRPEAMRAGLLPRYLGYIGVAAGVLVLFPIVPVPYVQCFWLAALAVLLAGRWPSGMPPAWTSGEAIPWAPAAPKTAGPRSRPPPPSLFGRRRATPSTEVVGSRRRPSAASSAERTRANTPKRSASTAAERRSEERLRRRSSAMRGLPISRGRIRPRDGPREGGRRAATPRRTDAAAAERHVWRICAGRTANAAVHRSFAPVAPTETAPPQPRRGGWGRLSVLVGLLGLDLVLAVAPSRPGRAAW